MEEQDNDAVNMARGKLIVDTHSTKRLEIATGAAACHVRGNWQAGNGGFKPAAAL